MRNFVDFSNISSIIFVILIKSTIYNFIAVLFVTWSHGHKYKFRYHTPKSSSQNICIYWIWRSDWMFFFLRMSTQHVHILWKLYDLEMSTQHVHILWKLYDLEMSTQHVHILWKLYDLEMSTQHVHILWKLYDVEAWNYKLSF